MLNNYKIDEQTGVLTQIEREPFVYDEHYVDRGYVNRIPKETLERMSTIRYNFMTDNIPFGYPQPDGILDVGYGDGSFLRYAQSKGHKVTGYDITEAHHNGDFPITNSLSEGEYHVITFFDSLEHFSDITETIKSLAPHKYIVVTVPCLRTVFTDEWFKEWKHRKENEHIHHFSPYTLINFFINMGYELVTIGNPEDEIRKGDYGYWNTTSAVFKKL